MEIIRGKIAKAQKVVLYGPEGIGKTTFAMGFPDPLFCDTEGGSEHLDVARTPAPTSWTMLLGIVREVIAQPSLCKTFVLDTADWAERLCVKHVCDVYKQQSVEGFGYGKGYVYVYEEFGKLLDLLTELRNKGVHPLLTAHSQLRKFEQPDEMGSYDRYELKLSKKTGACIADMIKEWSDLLLFANYKTMVVNVDGQGATKGRNKAQGGKRVMYATHTPSWDAKNRHGLPDELPFEFAAIAHLFADAPVPARPVEQPAPVIPTAQTQPHDEPDPEEGAQRRLATEKPQSGLNGVAATRSGAADRIGELPGDDAPKAIAETNQPADSLPRALRDLMQRDGATEQEIMYAVSKRGYYPNETPIANYAPDFVQGVLIGAWDQVFGMIQANREDVPF